MKQRRKALIAVVGAAVAVAGLFGVVVPPEVAAAVVTLSAVLVERIANA